MSLEPMLTVPGGSIEFSLGEGNPTAFHGAYTYADRNPFLPLALPFQYDEEGNPFLIDNHSIRYGDVYGGHFSLPDGFEDELLTGHGTVQLNPFLSGDITVAAVPEPSVWALTAVGIVIFMFRFRKRSAT